MSIARNNNAADVNFLPDALFSKERERIIAEYARRSMEGGNGRYAVSNPSQLFERTGRERAAVRLLNRSHCFPRPGDKCLEIGYGQLGWLGTLISWGLREEDLCGIELDARRASIAREVLPSADLRVGDATALPWPDGSFKFVIVSTVFTSILQAEMRERVAQEIVRVLAPGGALLWYDFAYNNPNNPNVSKVTKEEIRKLFAQLQGKVVRVTLAPPLARFVSPRSWVLATVLEALPLLRTHLLAILVKVPT